MPNATKRRNGTGLPSDSWARDNAIHARMQADKGDGATWKQMLDERMKRAFAEKNPLKVRSGLIETVSFAQAWIKALEAVPLGASTDDMIIDAANVFHAALEREPVK